MTTLETCFGTNPKYRITHQRQVILEEIRKTKTHPTADEIYDMVRNILPRISLGTIYRNLEILSSLGLIKKIGPISSQMRFDGNTDTHYHLHCISCGAVEDAPVSFFENLESTVQGVKGYHILGHSVEFLGICPRCRETADVS